jgi:hypothetical protein
VRGGDVISSGEDDGARGGRTGAVEQNVALGEELVESAGDHGIEEGELVVVVVVERGAVYISQGRDVVN